MTGYEHSSGYTYGTDAVPRLHSHSMIYARLKPPRMSSPVTQSCSHEQSPS